MKRLLYKSLIIWIVLSLHLGTTAQAADSSSDIVVNNEDELVTALADANIQSVNIGTDINISKITTLNISGDKKYINGNNHVLNIASGDISITSNVKIDGLNNLKITSNNNVNLTLKYGGNIDNLHGDKVTIASDGNLELYRSSLAYVKIEYGNDSKIVESEIIGKGINLNHSLNTIIDKVNINLGDTYNNGIVLSGRTSSDISNTTISGGDHGIYSSLNGMSANITNTKISGSKYNGIYNHSDVNGSHLVLSDVEISDTGSYGIFNTGTYSQGSITIAPETKLTLNTRNNIGIYQEYGYLNILGAVIHSGSQYTLFNTSNSTINDPSGMMRMISQNSSALLYNSINRSGDEVVLTSVQVKNEEELRNALLEEKINNVQLISNIEILNTSTIEVNGILKKLSGGNFKLIFSDSINPSIISNQFIEIENLIIGNNGTGELLLNKGGNLSNFISPKMRLNATGETHVLTSELEGISINSGHNSKIVDSTIGTSGIYFYLSKNTIIDKVNINLGDTYNNGIMLSTFTSSDISNTTINGGNNGIYSNLNGMTANVTNTQIRGSKHYGIYNHGDVNGSTLVLSNVEISDTGSYGIYNTGGYSQGSINIAPETTLTLNTGNNVGIYQENGYMNILGEVIHTGSQYTLFNTSNSTISDPNGMMKLMYQNSSALIYNSVYRSGDEVVSTSVQVKNEEELRNALLDEKVNTVKLMNNIEILNSSTIEVNGILKKLSGGNFKLIFSDSINPSIISNQSIEVENLTINNNGTGELLLNKGGNLSNSILPKMRLNATGETQVLSSELEGVSINSGNNSKIIDSTIGTSGIYFYLCKNTIIDKVNINLGDSYNNGITLSTFTSSDISNTTINGGYYGIFSSLNGMTANITNTKIRGSKQYGIYNQGAVNGSHLVLSNVEISGIGSYGIYNTGSYSQGSITVASGASLTLNSGSNIGVYQENGSFNLYGNINSTKYGIIISSDNKSQTNDYNNQLFCLNPTTDSFNNYVIVKNGIPMVQKVTVSPNQPAPQIAGTVITLKADSQGGVEPEYRFFARDEKGNLTLLQEYGSSNIATWKPAKPGTFTIIVHAKDKSKSGSYYFYEAKTEMVYKVNPGVVTSVNVQSEQPSSQTAGTSITLKAASQGSTEPEYRFLARDEKGNLTLLQEYGSSNTTTWKPAKPGTFTIIVHAKDKNKAGGSYFYEAKTEMVYKINPGVVANVNVQSEQPSPQAAGTSITLKAASQGSTEPEYRFFARDEKGNLTLLQEYGSSNTATWKPTKPGTFTIIVHAKDKNKSGANYFYDAKTEMMYKVNPGIVTNVQVQSEQPSPQAVGTSITLKADSQGSTEPEYRFLARDEKGNLTLLQDYGSSNTATWKPTKPGTYTIIVHAKDRNKTGANYFYEARTDINFKIN